MDELQNWLNSTFYEDYTSVTNYSGYYTERVSQGNYSYTTFELPFDVDVTTTAQRLDVSACAAFVLVILTFVTVVTWLRGALFK